MAKDEDYDFLDIDENMLDREWVKQPKLFFNWARKLAGARLRLDEAKADLDLVRADLDRDIRANPKKYNLVKVTEDAVKNCIVTLDEYLEALRMVNKNKHQVDIYDAAVKALDHKKRALEKLVDLHGQNYFSSPRTSDEGMRQAKGRAVSARTRRERSSDD
jgi:hypothetical protein